MFKQFCLVILLVGLPLRAAILLNEIPNYLLQQSYSDLTQRSLKKSCTSNLTSPISIPCNSISLIAIPKEKFFYANIYASDNIDDIETLNSLIKEDKDIELVEELLDKQEPINTQVSTSLNYTTSNFSLSAVPFRATIFSVIRDPVNPRAALYAAYDREVKLQYAYEIPESNWVVGTNVKFLHRTYILEEFTFLDAIFDIDAILNKKQYSALYFEPSVGYFFDTPWLPRFVLFAENITMSLGNNNRDFNEKPNINLAFGISPPLPLGFLELNLNYNNNLNRSYAKIHTFRFGGMYSLGLMNVAFGIDAYDKSLGVFSTLWSTRIGILYESRSLQNVIGEDVDDRSVLAEFSYIF